MVRRGQDLLLQVPLAGVVIQSGPTVLVQAGEIVVVMPVAGRRIGSHGNVHHPYSLYSLASPVSGAVTAGNWPLSLHPRKR
jgi:hypothetical protein